MFKKLVFMLIISIIPFNLFAEMPRRYFTYQSHLYDDGGGLLPDGPADITLRILDEGYSVLFEEVQSADVIDGAVSLIVGSSVGGVPSEIFSPAVPRYLEVQVGDYPPEGPMELLSVPYAVYADQALGLADGVVDSAHLKEGIVKMDHLSEGFIEELSSELSKEEGLVVSREEFDSYQGSLSGSGGASAIGIDAALNYSAGENIRDVIHDIDFAVKKREADSQIVDSQNLDRDGSDVMTGHLGMGGHRVSGLGAPSAVSDAATKGYSDGLFNAVSSTLLGHMNNQSNPHSVKAAQTGAVAEEDLMLDGFVKDVKIPATIARVDMIPDIISPQQFGYGRIEVVSGAWIVVEGNTSLECTLYDTGGGYDKNEWHVLCSLVSSSAIDCSSQQVCSMSGEIIPEFQVGVGGSLMTHRVPSSIKRYLERKHTNPGWSTTCYCREMIDISFGMLGYYPTGSFINWQLYKRNIGQ